jgi:hypothetical protein
MSNLCGTVAGMVTPKGSMSTQGETLQVSVLPYRCSICPFCCVCLGCCAAEFRSSRGTYELPCISVFAFITQVEFAYEAFRYQYKLWEKHGITGQRVITYIYVCERRLKHPVVVVVVGVFFKQSFCNRANSELICKTGMKEPIYSKSCLNGISRDQNIFSLKPGFRLIKVHYI